MNIGVLGTGIVGRTIASKLTGIGYSVMLGSRSATNEQALEWKAQHGKNASAGNFADTAKFGKLIFLATNGSATPDIIKLAGVDNFTGKTVIDISNPLDSSKGFPPNLLISNTNSLGEEVQRILPGANIVKTLNTLTADIMVDSSLLPQETDIFLSGNSAEAKEEVKVILKQFGWNNPIDLGDITTARGTEQLLPLWIRLYSAFGNASFNFKIVRS